MADRLTKNEVDYYQQLYFTFDKPIPLKDDLYIYPVKVKNYYDFYSCVDVLQLEKNEDMTGIGISKSHLEYLIYKAREESDQGQQITQKIIKLFELIFNVKNGLYCPECGKNESFDTYDNIYNHLKQYEDKISNEYELIEHINELRKCPICGKDRNDVIRFNPENENEIMVYDTCIDKDAYDFLRKIVLYQNMPDFNDEYINPDLKRDLELAAKLENPNNVTPTLEKQELCIVASTSYKIHEIEEMSIRHMVMLLRIVDAKIHYQVYQTAKTSGFVTFKGELEHWIYSSDKPHSMLEKAMSLEGLKGKMKPVTG